MAYRDGDGANQDQIVNLRDAVERSSEALQHLKDRSQHVDCEVCNTWWAKLFGLTNLCSENVPIEQLNATYTLLVWDRPETVTDNVTVTATETTIATVTTTETLTSTIWAEISKDPIPSISTETFTKMVWKKGSKTGTAEFDMPHTVTTVSVPVRYTPSFAGIWNTDWQQVLDSSLPENMDAATDLKYTVLIVFILYFLLFGIIRELVDWPLMFLGEDPLLPYRLVWRHIRGLKNDDEDLVEDDSDDEGDEEDEDQTASDQDENSVHSDDDAEDMGRLTTKLQSLRALLPTERQSPSEDLPALRYEQNEESLSELPALPELSPASQQSWSTLTGEMLEDENFVEDTSSVEVEEAQIEAEGSITSPRDVEIEEKRDEVVGAAQGEVEAQEDDVENAEVQEAHSEKVEMGPEVVDHTPTVLEVVSTLTHATDA